MSMDEFEMLKAGNFARPTSRLSLLVAVDPLPYSPYQVSLMLYVVIGAACKTGYSRFMYRSKSSVRTPPSQSPCPCLLEGRLVPLYHYAMDLANHTPSGRDIYKGSRRNGEEKGRMSGEDQNW